MIKFNYSSIHVLSGVVERRGSFNQVSTKTCKFFYFTKIFSLKLGTLHFKIFYQLVNVLQCLSNVLFLYFRTATWNVGKTGKQKIGVLTAKFCVKFCFLIYTLFELFQNLQQSHVCNFFSSFFFVVNFLVEKIGWMKKRSQNAFSPQLSRRYDFYIKLFLR